MDREFINPIGADSFLRDLAFIIRRPKLMRITQPFLHTADLYCDVLSTKPYSGRKRP